MPFMSAIRSDVNLSTTSAQPDHKVISSGRRQLGSSALEWFFSWEFRTESYLKLIYVERLGSGFLYKVLAAKTKI